MTGKKVNAAVLGFLNDLKSEGIKQVNENNVKQSPHPHKSDINVIPTPQAIKYRSLELETNDCNVWKYANRLIVNEQTCEELINSIKLIGQKVPVIVRPISQEETKFELICGARRLFACSKLEIKVKAVVADLTDKEALLIMDAENREREDISPYERALEYRSWVKSGIFKNYKEAMQEAGFKKSWFSKLIALADLDPLIVKAFRLPQNIKQVWGYKLVSLCKQKNPSIKVKILAKAKECSKTNLSPQEIFRELLEASENTQKKEPPIKIYSSSKKEIFTIEQNSNSTNFKFPRLEKTVLNSIAKLLKDNLDHK